MNFPGQPRTPPKGKRNARQIFGELSSSTSRLNFPPPAYHRKLPSSSQSSSLPELHLSKSISYETQHSRTSSGSRISKRKGRSFYRRGGSVRDETTPPPLPSSITSQDLVGQEPQHDPGSASRPILHFRPHLWKHLEVEREHLNLDLFWPMKVLEENIDCNTPTTPTFKIYEDDPLDIFPSEGLQPLGTFTNLRSLRIGGMLQSYQHSIWPACQANRHLLELILEMALPPDITPSPSTSTWRPISGTWHIDPTRLSTAYLGPTHSTTTKTTPDSQSQSGTLHATYGHGDLLDTSSIAPPEMAGTNLSTTALSTTRLILSGFVLNAQPFMEYNTFANLQEIVFKDGCIDAGFGLPRGSAVRIWWPNEGGVRAVQVERVVQGELRLVNVDGRRKKDRCQVEEEEEMRKRRDVMESSDDGGCMLPMC